MIDRKWKRAALGTLLVTTVAALSTWFVKARIVEAQSSSSIYLPNHQYDLPATHITAAQIQAHKLKMLGLKRDDMPMNMVNIGGRTDGKHQAGISVVYRDPAVLAVEPNNWAIHDDVAEIYYILEGSGTMQVGGKLINPVRRKVSAGNGMGISSKTGSEGAQSVNLAQGDILIIPAGTPHKFTKANEFTVYTVVRIDPDGVTPLKSAE